MSCPFRGCWGVEADAGVGVTISTTKIDGGVMSKAGVVSPGFW